MNYRRFLTSISKARKVSPISELIDLLLGSPPSTVSFGSGFPNPVTFPFKNIDVQVADGTHFQLAGDDLSRALQYSQSPGIPELVKWVERLHKHFHNPPIMQSGTRPGFGICITAGSQDGIAKVLEMLLSPGESLLIENPNYPGTISFLNPLPVKILPVGTDKYGMKSLSLGNIMKQWKPSDAANPDSGIPKVLYTVPNSGNPTGATASLQRKHEIYEIAQMYDLVIVEDDPYYFLQYDENKTPSYQALDMDGRVIRSDSMSKVLAAGLRIGWISGPKPFIKQVTFHQEVTVMHNSTFTQMMALKLLDLWGLQGFEKHLHQIQSFYKSQRDVIIECAEKYLTGLAEWNVPEGGLFLWIKIPCVVDSTELIKKHALGKGVILFPGKYFEVLEDSKSAYCRASFSLPSKEDIDKGVQRFADVIRDEMERK